MNREYISMAEGDCWEVRINKSGCQIVDAEGRERYRGTDHMHAAIFLAMELSKHPFQSTESLDTALKMRADSFIK